MIIIEHRINTLAQLSAVPSAHGVEVDVRNDPQNDRLVLNHDPGMGEDLEHYLGSFNHAFIIFNIKEAGIEARCLALAAQYNIAPTQYFLLDVEFPYLYRASRKEGVREIAVRFSEAEPIEMALAQKGFVDWLWIDTNTQLPLNEELVSKMQGFKTCLVGPDRWGRPEEIQVYLEHIQSLGLILDAVMVGSEYAGALDSHQQREKSLPS